MAMAIGRPVRRGAGAMAAAALACLLAAAPVEVGAAAAPRPPASPAAPAAPVAPTKPLPPLAPGSGASAPSPGAAAPTSAGGAGASPAGAVGALVQEALRHLPSAHLDAVLSVLAAQAGVDALPGPAAAVGELLHGRLPLAPRALLALAVRDFGREVVAAAGLLGRLVVLAVGASLLDLLGRSMGREEAARLGAVVVELALVALALASLTVAFALARTVVDDLEALMAAVLPLMIGLLAGMGAVTSAALFQPLVLGATELVGHLVASAVLPLLYAGGVLEVVGRLTPYRLGNVASLLRAAGLWALGAGLTAFLGVVVVAGSLGPVSDGLTLKAGKFLANAFIPVVGKMFADATEMVMGTSLLLKNAVGAVGLIALLVTLALPVAKLMALSFTYRLAGAAVAPASGGAVPDVLGSMGQTLVFVAVAVGAMALMCFITLAALMAAGSAGVLP
ncbi:MAG: stage III sporulation protein AE [Firmicutes bacterium]|nr:stage III sporulation protein AE [Bacillota bacterium]